MAQLLQINDPRLLAENTKILKHGKLCYFTKSQINTNNKAKNQFSAITSRRESAEYGHPAYSAENSHTVPREHKPAQTWGKQTHSNRTKHWNLAIPMNFGDFSPVS